MSLRKNLLLEDERQERRWRITDKGFPFPGGDCPLRVWPVADLRLHERPLHLIALNYEGIPKTRLVWDIPLLRTAFSRLVRAMSPNLSFLPEPIDLIAFLHNNLPAEIALGEPALILEAPKGSRIFPPRSKDLAYRIRWMRQLCLNLAHSLRELHHRGTLLRALPLAGIRRNEANKTFSTLSFQYLLSMDDFRGYHPHEAAIHPPAQYAAPECFAPNGHLTPAADVYALARLLLEALGEELQPAPLSPDEIDAVCARQSLPPTWTRFFKLALAIEPTLRFDGMREVLTYINSDGASTHPNAGRRLSTAPSASSSPPRLSGRLSTTQPSLSAQPRNYRDDAPPAALIVWTHQLSPKDLSFDYHAFLRDLQPRFSLAPLLAFALEQQDPDNLFFQFLRRIGFQLITLPSHALQAHVLDDCFARWRDTPRLFLLANAKEYAASHLLKQAQAHHIQAEFYYTDGSPPPETTAHPAKKYQKPKTTQRTTQQRR